VLDIGVGNGVMGWEIQRRLKCTVTGTDVLNYVETPITFAKMKTPDKLPFKDVTFDFAMLNGVLHHIDADVQSKVLLEGLRVAKYLLIFDDQPSWRSRWICFVLNKIHEPRMYLPETFRSDNQWSAMFKKLNLNFEFSKVELPWWYPLPHIAFRVWKKI
jgi:ubiquinone/menaquinone biosynthesis C-methylase UbiE